MNYHHANLKSENCHYQAVIEIPAIPTINTGNYEDFVKKYEAAKNILETWILN